MGTDRQHSSGKLLQDATLTGLFLVCWAAAAPLFAESKALPNYLATLPPGTLTSAIPTLSDPTQTWDLYLPRSFSPARKWPVLLLFDPRARGKLAADLFRDAADEFGWILASSNNTRSDGPGEPNARALNAMIPDVVKRLPVDPRRIYAGGFSGGGMLAWTVGLKGGYLAGVISIGGRPESRLLDLVPKFALFAAAGERDFNFQATTELDRLAAKARVPHRLEFFPGPHAWCPPDMARRAVRWLEVLAMREGLAPPDPERTKLALAEELAAAEAQANRGEALAAGRRYREIAETYRGLGDPDAVARAELRAGELLASPAAKSAIKAEQAAAKFESQALHRIGEAIARLREAEDPVAPGELRHILALDDALRLRKSGGTAGAAAERALAAMQAQLAFYLTRDLFAADDYRRAIPALQLVAEAFPDDADTLYNLACALARSGSPESALATLAQALDHGLAQPLQMETDADLASLRGRPEFAKLLLRARASAGGSDPPHEP